MASILTFAPNRVQTIITYKNIVHQLSGFAEDQILSVARVAERHSLYNGSDNVNTRIINSNDSALVTLYLQQTSVSNDFLQYIYDQDVEAEDIIFEIMIKDLSGRSTYLGREAWINKLPDSSFSNSMEIREWEIQVNHMETQLGGNGKFSEADYNNFTAMGGDVADRWVP